MSFEKLSGLSVLLSAAILSTGSAMAAGAPKVRPTVVLVHGAFADGSSWSKVLPHLGKAGYQGVAVQNPLTSLADDAAVTRRAIEQAPGDVVLVGHSWGGAVISEVGVHPKVKALVYVTAFAPGKGQSVQEMIDAVTGGKPAPWAPEMRVDAGGFLTFSSAGMIKYFAQDLPSSQAQTLAMTQGPWKAASLKAKTTAAAWESKPSWYVVAKDDQIIPAPFQASMAERIQAQVVTVKGSHLVMLSQPKAVAKVIIAAAKATP